MREFKIYGISIHAPTRGATLNFSRFMINLKFQSTLPREERLCIIMCPLLVIIFQSTLPREERQKCRVWLNNQRNFNPRSHERSDHFDTMEQKLLFISIHAPTRGATITFRMSSSLILFQSTLPREERRV